MEGRSSTEWSKIPTSWSVKEVGAIARLTLVMGDKAKEVDEPTVVCSGRSFTDIFEIRRRMAEVVVVMVAMVYMKSEENSLSSGEPVALWAAGLPPKSSYMPGVRTHRSKAGAVLLFAVRHLSCSFLRSVARTRESLYWLLLSRLRLSYGTVWAVLA